MPKSPQAAERPHASADGEKKSAVTSREKKPGAPERAGKPEPGEGKTASPHPRPLDAETRRKWKLGLLIAAGAMVLLVLFGVMNHLIRAHRQNDFANRTALPAVNYITAHRDTKPHDLVLPGTVQAFLQAQLYAQVTGYLAKWYVDIGDRVVEGQLLAEIQAPQVDAQLRQAAAAAAQARANLEIARLTYTRETDLLIKKVVSEQEFDQSRTSYDAAQAALQASQASVQNLQVQQNFEKIVAPFTGRITTRQIDIGALVSAGSGSAGTPLYGIAQTDPLRVYASVPQSDSPSIHLNMPAQLFVPEYPGRGFKGKVARFSGAIDPASRTLLTEVDIPNPDGALDAGMYGEVKFVLKEENAPIVVPSDALVFQAPGPQLVTVTPDGRIQRLAVHIGRDFGTQMEVLDGLQDNAKVVMNPTDDLTDGLQVQATPVKETPQAGSSPAASGVPKKSAQ